MDLTSDLSRLAEENASLREALASEQEKVLSQRQELIVCGEEMRILVSHMEDVKQELFGRGEEIMMFVADVSFLRSQLNDMEDMEQELFSRGEEIMMLVADNSSLKIQLSDKNKENAELLAKLEKEQLKSKCKICSARAWNIVILPCSHSQFCSECVQQHRERATTCPTCGVPITGILDLCLS